MARQATTALKDEDLGKTSDYLSACGLDHFKEAFLKREIRTITPDVLGDKRLLTEIGMVDEEISRLRAPLEAESSAPSRNHFDHAKKFSSASTLFGDASLGSHSEDERAPVHPESRERENANAKSLRFSTDVTKRANFGAATVIGEENGEFGDKQPGGMVVHFSSGDGVEVKDTFDDDVDANVPDDYDGEEYFDEEEEEEEEESPIGREDVNKRYFDVARELSQDKTFDVKKGEMPKRAPYTPHVQMMHGAHYFSAFRDFLEKGGCAHYKNSVVMNIRVNNIAELDVMKGSCTVNFFLDLAFWVPAFDKEHYADPDTVGRFTLYEPIIDFPDMAHVEWVRREVEFSKNPGTRRHEIQLGQNFDTGKKSTDTDNDYREFGKDQGKSFQYGEPLSPTALSNTTNPMYVRGNRANRRVWGVSRSGSCACIGGVGGSSSPTGVGSPRGRAVSGGAVAGKEGGGGAPPTEQTDEHLEDEEEAKTVVAHGVEPSDGSSGGGGGAGGEGGRFTESLSPLRASAAPISKPRPRASCSVDEGAGGAAEARRRSMLRTSEAASSTSRPRRSTLNHDGASSKDPRLTMHSVVKLSSMDMLKKGVKKHSVDSTFQQHAKSFMSGAKASASQGLASDSKAHWPRLWRVFISDEDLEKFVALPKAEKKKLEPTNSKPENGITDDMRALLERLDAQREQVDLKEELEGLVFSTYEIECVSRQTYGLHDFPFDVQGLDMVVRLDRMKGDPLKRHIVPSCHDKAFFCSSRVPPLIEWHISKNLDWYVERGARGNESLDGGKERLVSSIIVMRKSYYYSRHFLSILFLMTSSVFSSFAVPADEIETRSNIIFSLLLTVVAFNYSTTESIPNVPYATVLELFINTCFLAVLAVGVATLFFSWLLRNFPNMYSEKVESLVGFAAFFTWLVGNFTYWNGIVSSMSFIRESIEKDEQIGWLKFSERAQASGRSLSTVPRNAWLSSFTALCPKLALPSGGRRERKGAARAPPPTKSEPAGGAHIAKGRSEEAPQQMLLSRESTTELEMLNRNPDMTSFVQGRREQKDAEVARAMAPMEALGEGQSPM